MSDNIATPSAPMASFADNAAMVSAPAPPPIAIVETVLVEEPSKASSFAFGENAAFWLWDQLQDLMKPKNDPKNDNGGGDIVQQLSGNAPDDDASDAISSEAETLWTEITAYFGHTPKSEAELLALLEKLKADDKAFEARINAQLKLPTLVEKQITTYEEQPVLPSPIAPAMALPKTVLVAPTEPEAAAPPTKAESTILAAFTQQKDMIAKADVAPENEKPNVKQQPLNSNVVNFKLSLADVTALPQPSVKPVVSIKPAKTLTYGMAA